MMFKSYEGGRQDSKWKTLRLFTPFTLSAVVFGLLLGAVIGAFEPVIWAGVVGAVVLAVLIVLRQDAIIATLIVAIHLYLDWYLGLAAIAQVITLVLLLIFYLLRSEKYLWGTPRALWLWCLFLLLAILPALEGLTLNDGAYYYINVIFGAFVMCWLGLVIARDIPTMRSLFRWLSLFGTLVAIHTIIQAATGTLLFGTSRYDLYLTQVSNYPLGSTGVYRAGTFLVNPDSAGAFFATMFLIPLGLFIACPYFLEKLIYLGEAIVMVPALLFTYSTGAWAAALGGLFFFIILVGRRLYTVQLLICFCIFALVLFVGFPLQVGLQLQHALDPTQLALRLGVWQTGLRVIQAYPLHGVGLGRYVYFERADPYRVPAQIIPVYHPHNSYLELAALGGIPLAIVFIALLGLALWSSLKNRRRTDRRTRALLGGGIAAVMALSINSLFVAGWTLAPLTAIGWLILGALSSPLLANDQDNQEINPAQTAVAAHRG